MAIDYQGLSEEIRARADIVEVVSDYVELRRAGANYKGLCPFHTEKTPSFMVTPHKQIFHCFGCSTGGDVISFVMKKEHLSYVEALQLLAQRCGIKFNFNPQRSRSLDAAGAAGTAGAATDATESRAVHLKVLNTARGFFIEMLKKSPVAQQYLKSRGLTPEIAGHFSLGFAPEGWDNLYRYLRRQGFADGDIKAAALLYQKDNSTYDVFRNRVIFPITDIHGQTIAFGGRVINSDAQPKYLNSAETAMFKKKLTLFGLYPAREEIVKSGYAIIVEGYLDVIVCAQYGFANVCAPLGTALTQEQVRILRRYTRQVCVVFDGDDAGIKAAKRALAIICKNGLEARAMLLPPKDDPDSFLRARGSDAFRQMVLKSQGVVDFFLTAGGHGMDNIRELYACISEIEDTVLRGSLITELSNKASISEGVLMQDLRKGKPSGPPQPAQKSPLLPKRSEEETLLNLCLCFPDGLRIVKERLSLDSLSNVLVRRVFDALIRAEVEASFESLAGFFTEQEMACISGLMIEPEIDRDNIDKNIEDYIKSIKRHVLEKTLGEINVRLGKANLETDSDEILQLQMQQIQLRKQISKL
ncbi:DNA primase [Candidatus Magnetobacterium bavaricum]|uniref:DNA primase n=1 Tax=Candidatus Magnetobacterium bavaricum TaxID=29290 RepID=A0A0F3GPH2_9BACT|nr:DNA primase [Candidatus Magnetobacterium bavaricum]